MLQIQEFIQYLIYPHPRYWLHSITSSNTWSMTGNTTLAGPCKFAIAYSTAEQSFIERKTDKIWYCPLSYFTSKCICHIGSVQTNCGSLSSPPNSLVRLGSGRERAKQESNEGGSPHFLAFPHTWNSGLKIAFFTHIFTIKYLTDNLSSIHRFQHNLESEYSSLHMWLLATAISLFLNWLM